MSAKTVGLSDHFDVNCRDARIRFFKAIPPQPLFFLYGNSKGKTLKVNAWLSNYGKPRVCRAYQFWRPCNVHTLVTTSKRSECLLSIHVRALKINFDKQIWFFDKTIWVSHWHHSMVDGTKFWISCQRLSFLSSFSQGVYFIIVLWADYL